MEKDGINEKNTEKSGPWVKLMLSPFTGELIKNDHCVLILLLVIAWRSRRLPGKSPDGVEHGWAKLGDHDSYGMTRKKYRTTLDKIESMGLAAFIKSSKGTLGKLTNKRVFDIAGLLKGHLEGQLGASLGPVGGTTEGQGGATFIDNKTEEERYIDLLDSSFSSLLEQDRFKVLDDAVFRTCLRKWWLYRIFQKKPPPRQGVEMDCVYALSIGVVEAQARLSKAIRSGWNDWQYEPAKASVERDEDGDEVDLSSYAHKGRLLTK